MSIRIEDVADRNRLELYEDGTRVGELHYQRARDILVLEHTEVHPDQQGKGYAGQLVQAALNQAKGEHRRVIVVCPYAKAWLQRHPDYGDLDYTHARVPVVAGTEAGALAPERHHESAPHPEHRPTTERGSP